MFASPAFAQTATAGAASGGAASFLLQIAPLLFIFVIFYFLLIRPQTQRMKKHRAMIEAVKKGDSVVTGGGFIGRVTRVDEDEVEVELAPGMKVRALKSTLSEVRLPGGKPAND
ncbi:preprotein translocase subunit YajC [Sphingomonas quercus]|uniref:Sec translocon accessory complex subunit YajC n=1 Tax=Sphingomonas quercus TaxID=2842451 RepID=A0ABS6BMT8_9SPHN|nr:preprotein translocase subunit YajC [Sphingomonas quercus]MBU3079167.1 preprotein translocase subunit YajC [Sphingomonas quercus]